MEAPVADGRFPLVMISHGSGGSNLTHRTLGMYLAQNGFVVGIPEHPFNNRHNNELQYSVQNMIDRPRHLRLAMDEVFSHEKFKNHLDIERVAGIGHSVGGYTVLALAGGIPHTQALVELCQKPASADEPYWFNLLRKNGIKSQPIAVTADCRIKAVVLLAPDVSLFMSAGLCNMFMFRFCCCSPKKIICRSKRRQCCAMVFPNARSSPTESFPMPDIILSSAPFPNPSKLESAMLPEIPPVSTAINSTRS